MGLDWGHTISYTGTSMIIQMTTQSKIMTASSLLLQRLWEVVRAVGAGEGEVVRGTAFSVNFDIGNINIRSAAPSTSTMQPTTASSLNCSWWMHVIYREHSEMQWSRTPQIASGIPAFHGPGWFFQMTLSTHLRFPINSYYWPWKK